MIFFFKTKKGELNEMKLIKLIWVDILKKKKKKKRNGEIGKVGNAQMGGVIKRKTAGEKRV